MGQSDLGLASQRITALRINDHGRVEATVVLGTMRHDMAISAYDPDISEQVTELHNALLGKFKRELVKQLETDLSSSTRSALSR